ncbi:MAG: hypothetical protein Fur0037_27790 [Planctomycetota bacterium]
MPKDLGQGSAIATPRDGPTWFAGKALFWWLWPPLVALDLWSKAWAFGFLASDERYRSLPEMERRHEVFDGALRFQIVSWRNPGTIWGLFPDYTVPLIALRIAALFVLAWYLRKASARARVQQAVLALITAGAIGNLYDNFFAAGHRVRDFLYFTGDWPVAWTFPAFNVADSCITVGAVALVFLLMGEDRAVRGSGSRVS